MSWKESVSPTLLRRLLRPVERPGVIRMSLVRRLLAELAFFRERISLSASVLQRRGVRPGFGRGQVPIVHAQWIGDWTQVNNIVQAAGAPATLVERIIVRASEPAIENAPGAAQPTARVSSPPGAAQPTARVSSPPALAPPPPTLTALTRPARPVSREPRAAVMTAQARATSQRSAPPAVVPADSPTRERAIVSPIAAATPAGSVELMAHVLVRPGHAAGRVSGDATTPQPTTHQRPVVPALDRAQRSMALAGSIVEPIHRAPVPPPIATPRGAVPASPTPDRPRVQPQPSASRLLQGARAPLTHAGTPERAASAGSPAPFAAGPPTATNAARSGREQPFANPPQRATSRSPVAAPPRLDLDDLARRVQQKLVQQMTQERIRRGHLR
jgi:hypothetical protein